MGLRAGGEGTKKAGETACKQTLPAEPAQLGRRAAVTAELLHDAPDEDIHNLRKLLKRIRYLMELDIDSWKSALKTLRQRQDLYGRFQDLHVQIELVSRFASNHPDDPSGALQALLHHLAVEKDDARRLILSIGGLKSG